MVVTLGCPGLQSLPCMLTALRWARLSTFPILMTSVHLELNSNMLWFGKPAWTLASLDWSECTRLATGNQSPSWNTARSLCVFLIVLGDGDTEWDLGKKGMTFSSFHLMLHFLKKNSLAHVPMKGCKQWKVTKLLSTCDATSFRGPASELGTGMSYLLWKKWKSRMLSLRMQGCLQYRWAKKNKAAASSSGRNKDRERKEKERENFQNTLPCQRVVGNRRELDTSSREIKTSKRKVIAVSSWLLTACKLNWSFC